MPDWKEEIRERLSTLKLAPTREVGSNQNSSAHGYFIARFQREKVGIEIKSEQTFCALIGEEVLR